MFFFILKFMSAFYQLLKAIFLAGLPRPSPDAPDVNISWFLEGDVS
jgi:hypothetical protein